MPIHDAPIGSCVRLGVRQILVELAFVLLLVVLLAVMGPFGTFQTGTWPVRLAYWARTLLFGYLLFRPGIGLAGRAALSLGFSRPIGWAAAVLVLSVPMTFWLWFVGPSIDLHRPWPMAPQFMETYAQIVFIAGLAATGLWWLAGPAGGVDRIDVRNASPESSPAEPSGSEGPPVIGHRLTDRMPLNLGLDIIALEMEDHYVRVHTARGNALVLMRMGDAVADLAAIDGLRVHRSWWAARGAVDHVVRNGRTILLAMKGGLEVPVARDRLPDLHARGWLEPG